MKKHKIALMLITILTLLAVAPVVVANRFPMITIDNADIDVETIIKDDRIYVPLRFMSEYLGCEVGWTGQTAIIKTPQYYADTWQSVQQAQQVQQPVQQALPVRQGYVEGKGYIRPIISGTPKFIQEINKAMDILQDMDPAGYALVCQNVERICLNNDLGKEGDMFIIARANDKQIEFSEPFVKDIKFQPRFIAGCLVHEATHCCYFKNGNVYDFVKCESIAYTYQLATFQLIKADQWMIDETQNTINRRFN